MSVNFLATLTVTLGPGGLLSKQDCDPLLQEDHCLHRSELEFLFLEKERPKTYLNAGGLKALPIVCNRVGGGFGVYGSYNSTAMKYPVILNILHPGMEVRNALFNLSASFQKLDSKDAVTRLLLGDEEQEFCLKFMNASNAHEICFAMSKRRHQINIQHV